MMDKIAPVRVWDLPTRLFHWAIVVLIGMSWWSAENHAMDWHRLFGLIALGLILFRLIWGFIGGSTARFSSFLRSPGSVVAYLRSDGPRRAGHNPLGAYSAIAMILLIVLQISTGLFAVDVDGIESGYLSHLVSFDQGRLAADIHEISFNVLLAVIGLHILAILFYLVIRRRNLVVPMFTGSDRQVETTGGALVPAGPVKFAIAAAVAAGLALWASMGFGL
jgi:cytochrome b